MSKRERKKGREKPECIDGPTNRNPRPPRNNESAARYSIGRRSCFVEAQGYVRFSIEWPGNDVEIARWKAPRALLY